MKKLITTAALLAAGTAFANATGAFSGIWTDFSSDSPISWLSASTTGCTVNSNGSVSTTTSAHVAFDITSSTDYLYANSNENNAWSIAMTFDASSISQTETTTFFGLDVGLPTNNGYMSLCGAYYDPTTGTLTLASYNVSDTDSTLSLPTSGTLTLIASRSSTRAFSLSVYAGTELISTLSAGSLAYSGKAVKTFDIGGHNSTVTGTDYVMSGSPSSSELTLTGMAIYKGDVLTADDTALATYFAAAIPEPSAFGLLAGVGALALVAARRRRRAK